MSIQSAPSQVYGRPVVEQYAAIRTRQREIAVAERRTPSPVAPSPAPRSYAIWVRHAGRLWFLSWLLGTETPMLSPHPEAAMRFGRPETAAALIERIPALREKARHGEAGINDVRRPYGGISLRDRREEERLPPPPAAPLADPWAPLRALAERRPSPPMMLPELPLAPPASRAIRLRCPQFSRRLRVQKAP